MSDELMAIDRLPTSMRDYIEKLFPRSEKRRRVAYTLMFWNHRPNSKEQDELGEWAGYAGGGAVRAVPTG